MNNTMPTIEDYLDELDGVKRPPVTAPRFDPARLPDTPQAPEPGIYFGMPEDDYHAIPALNSSGIKQITASPMLFWSKTDWLCELARQKKADATNDDDKYHQTIGKAYHARILEGREAFASRFAIELGPADYPDAISSTDDIKAAIREAGAKPITRVKDGFQDNAAKKDDWIAQLLELDPDAQVMSALKAKHREAHAGKTFISANDYTRLEIAAAMIERDPYLTDTFHNGYPEVTLIWRCATTGVLMKARADYLKLDAIVDLKSIGNQREMSIEQAIRSAIGSYKYNFQPCLYQEGVLAVRELVREHGASVVHTATPDGEQGEVPPETTFALEWSRHKGNDEWHWIFQCKGDAPITRGVRFPSGGFVESDTCDLIERAKRKFVQYSEVYGCEPWLDLAPIYTISDEDFPRWATEI